ncbi:acetate/propionate family kinase [Vagococcus humatus]|uniref:Acetate kinase n=1 Tax=Vagococcus humatus TaxID=1889241 RepID=A0A3R9YC98_9ENTE|nr:acetate kinase [Vagococcus humatus]RST89039.1 acetate kinase [Vagococcus humatus]
MSTKVMAINSGSSSLKFKLFEMPEEVVITEGAFERIGLSGSVFGYTYKGEKTKEQMDIANHEMAVKHLLDTLIEQNIIESYDEIVGVGHRISHGGTYYQDATLIDDLVEQHIEELSVLSPLHNPVNLIGIRSFKNVLPHAKQVAIFDTSFHQGMPEKNYMYALPYKYYEEYSIRRYGFHGPSHQYVTEEALKFDPEHTKKLIVCHIGSGGSIAAMVEGQSINTSMGFTPLSGLVMGTRTGDLDPQILPFIQEKEGLSPQELRKMMHEDSGLLGLSGISSDYRDVEEAADNGNERAKMALEVFAQRVIFYIGAYAAQMNGVDCIAFTAGVGEHSDRLRKYVCDSLSYLGVEIDEEKNHENAWSLETENSKVRVLVIPTDEEVVIARDVMRIAKL